MATIGMGDIKKGARLEITGNPYKVTDFQHVKARKRCSICTYED